MIFKLIARTAFAMLYVAASLSLAVGLMDSNSKLILSGMAGHVAAALMTYTYARVGL